MIPVAIVIFSILWVMRAQREVRIARARACGAEEGARQAAIMASQAVVNIRVVTIFFTDGPLEQRFYVQPDFAQKEAETIKPGDYAGDGRRVTEVVTFQPFVMRNT
jgi:hypothetical protein